MVNREFKLFKSKLLSCYHEPTEKEEIDFLCAHGYLWISLTDRQTAIIKEMLLEYYPQYCKKSDVAQYDILFNGSYYFK